MSENPPSSVGYHHVRWLFHATAMVNNIEKTHAALRRLAGLRVLEHTAIADPAVGRRGGMAWLADGCIELGEPYGSQSPVAAFLERRGAGLHSFGVQVSDLDATVAHLAAHDVRIAARSDEFSFIFCRPKDTEGLLVQFASVEMAFDPRFGAPLPALDSEPVIDATHIAFIGARVADPEASAERLAEIIGTSATATDFASGPQFTVSLGDCVLALWPAAEGARSELHAIGLRVPALAGLAAVLEDAGFVSEPGDLDASLQLSREQTGEVPILLVDRFLPGDPRATMPTRG